MDLSVCMIVKNEAANIERAIRSIPCGVEIIVVDTGSTDRTIEIAGSLGAKVYSKSWTGHYGNARNESIRLATKSWVLILDADEELADNFSEKFARLKSGSVYAVKIQNVSSDSEEATIHRMVRLFPNHKRYQFHGRVHEQLYEGKQAAAFVYSDILIVHHGYQQASYQEKFERYESIYNQWYADDPNNGYMLYQFGKLYYSVQQWEAACEWFSKGLERNEVNKLYFPPMIVQFSYALHEIGLTIEALTLLIDYSTTFDQYPDLFFAIAMLSIEAQQYQNIEPALIKAIEIGDQDKYVTTIGVGSYKAQYNLGLFYELNGEIDKAMLQYELSSKKGFNLANERYQIMLNRA